MTQRRDILLAVTRERVSNNIVYAKTKRKDYFSVVLVIFSFEFCYLLTYFRVCHKFVIRHE